MKPENEGERQEAMQAAKSKKTFQKAVAANDAFEFCRCAPSAHAFSLRVARFSPRNLFCSVSPA